VVPVLGRLYDLYSFNVLPWLGRAVAGDAESYRYLAESIRRHPDQESLLALMKTAGLESCRYHNLMGGIVAVHRGYRY
jgi:demethylmenaquinone methyltransferase / 2-methoxy-6-polyprenyl-1,4-benzoquinol methylase